MITPNGMSETDLDHWAASEFRKAVKSVNEALEYAKSRGLKVSHKDAREWPMAPEPIITKHL